MPESRRSECCAARAAFKGRGLAQTAWCPALHARTIQRAKIVFRLRNGPFVLSGLRQGKASSGTFPYTNEFLTWLVATSGGSHLLFGSPAMSWKMRKEIRCTDSIANARYHKRFCFNCGWHIMCLVHTNYFIPKSLPPAWSQPSQPAR